MALSGKAAKSHPVAPLPKPFIERLKGCHSGHQHKGVAPAVPHLVLHIPLFIACRRVAELRPWGEEEGMERVEFSPQAGTKQSGISSDEMEHKPGKALCKLPFPIFQHLDHRCGQIVKSQPRRYSADALKDPLQTFQQTFLILRREELCVPFVGLRKTYH